LADLTVTAASVAPGANARIDRAHAAGEALATAGLAVYLKSSDNRWYLSDTDVAEPLAVQYGVTLNAAPAAGLPIAVQYGGDLTAGATLVVGEVYGVGEAAGGIAPKADCVATEYERILGIARTAAILELKPIWSSVVRAA
jgi:hypothetical protein